MKTSELSGHALDRIVSQLEGWTYRHDFKYGDMFFPPNLYKGETTRWEASPPKYSVNWAQGGPIIDREEITCGPWTTSPCMAHYGTHDTVNSKNVRMTGSTQLIAAMRCYVASKLGDEIDIPKELL